MRNDIILLALPFGIEFARKLLLDLFHVLLVPDIDINNKRAWTMPI